MNFIPAERKPRITAYSVNEVVKVQAARPKRQQLLTQPQKFKCPSGFTSRFCTSYEYLKYLTPRNAQLICRTISRHCNR